MDRLVHHELRAANSALLAAVITIAVTAVVQGFPAPEMDWRSLGIATGGLALWTFVKTTRVKGFGLVREFERADPVEDAGRTPDPDVPLGRDHPVNGTLLFLYLAVTLPGCLFWARWVLLLPVISAVTWLSDAAVAAYWERRNGLVLWRGHVSGDPWRLSVSPRPATRSATGGPDASPTPPVGPAVPGVPPGTPPPTT